MRAMWKGSVSFGLVSIPIQLYAATENKNVSLRQVHEADGGRIQYKRFCTVDGQEVPYAEIAKGYELPDGEMVVLTDAEMAELPLPTQRMIDVLEFVPMESIDPIQFDKTYYLEPQKNAVKPYVVLRDALQKASHVAIAKVAVRQRESLAVLRVHDDVLVMTTMLWPDEVRVPDFPFLHEDLPQVRAQEITMAGSLIDSLSEPVFEAEKYSDSYREALESMIEAKAAGNETAKPGPVAAKADVVDLMSALQASVNAAKKSRKPATTRKPAARKASGKGDAEPKAAKKPATPRARRSPKSA
ncbi:non-homologous end joining protein Ku [Amycolatopsis samaneae]|uniref:Non-homologous end joining protein Ku n=1 Tax=Amycolatopsis samaneae TaxID=664691 RepID=A0ABW5GH23_9PSEU